MGKFKAVRHLTLDHGGKDGKHRQLSAGDVFECDDEYAQKHLSGLVEDGGEEELSAVDGAGEGEEGVDEEGKKKRKKNR